MEFRRDIFYQDQQNSFSSPIHQSSSTIPSTSFFLSLTSPSSSSTTSSTSSTQPFSWRNAENSHVEKEHMFDKVVTPSDVGKLNRLVIPKQQAERHFPLDSTANEKGLLLCFEDRTGKSWRFRYSYWNSSQSYVMTKGWSRFVKEKRLDAGDTVSFGRGVGDDTARSRLFIDWRRRPENRATNPAMARVPLPPLARSVVVPWNGAGGRIFLPPSNFHYNCDNYGAMGSSSGAGISNGGNQVIYFRASPTTRPPAVQENAAVLDSVPVVQNTATAKRVRLFGVNLESRTESEFIDRTTSNTHQELMELMPSNGETTAGSSLKNTTTKERHLSFDLDL